MVAQAQHQGPAATWTNTAQRRDQRLGAIPWDTGQNIDRRLALRNAGYLEYLRLTPSVAFQYATAGPTGTDAFGTYGGILAWVRVRANNVGTLFDCSGEGAALISAISDQYLYGAGSVTPTPPYNFPSAPALVATTAKWSIDIPFALYLANKPSPLGLFQTATNANETSLELRFRPIVATAGTPGSGLYTGNGGNLVGGASGNVDIQQAFFDPIADPAAQPTLGYIHMWREQQTALTADGDTEIILQPSNIYCRIIVWIITGGAGALAPDSTHLQKLSIRYGANLPIYEEITDAVNARMQRMYNMVLPGGVYIIDLLENTHDERDLIDSAATTNLRLVINMLGATYTGGAYAKLLIEQLVPLEVPA
jgi:hypothetical protein